MIANVFYNILKIRYSYPHDGRPLWKYDLTTEEFKQLQGHLMKTRSLSSIDPRDCTLYYAEWWKRCYNGGSPSKREIFRTIRHDDFFQEEQFFEQAKKGANILGIKWIKGQNTLYFKTLLLQGGLPLNHIFNNQKAYASFLLKILKLNPTTIDDFAFDYQIIKLLPPSSRNDIIYENCLEIVKGENQHFLNMLDTSQDLKLVADEIRNSKIRKQVAPKSKIKAYWVLSHENEIASIRLYLSIPETVSADVMKNTFLINNQSLSLANEYHLFINGDLSCKFRKKIDGNYKTLWFKNHNLNWSDICSLPEVYLKDIDGNKIEVSSLINHYPKLSQPTLWSLYSEKEWILEKGKNSSHATAFVIIPEGYSIITPINGLTNKKISILDKELTWVEFNDEIAIKNNGPESFKFYSNKSKLDWFILNSKPDWMFKSNIPVVTNRPKVLVFNEQGDHIHNPEIKWRKKVGYQQWQALSNTLPIGCLEIKIIANNIEETDEIYNIGNLDFKVSSAQINTANIKATNGSFSIQLKQQPEYEIAYLSQTNINLTLTNNHKLPKTITGSLNLTGESKRLHFEITPPFKGLEILNANGDIIPNNSTLFSEDIFGFRIMSNEDDLVVNIYNNKRPNIIISQPLNNKYCPLREFDEPIQKLAKLSEVNNETSYVALEISRELRTNGISKRLKSYQISNYTDTIVKSWDNEELVLSLRNNSDVDLYAVPVNCQIEELRLYSLINEGGKYRFDIENALTTFIVFSNCDAKSAVLPAFVSIMPIAEIDEPSTNASSSIDLYKQKLLNEDRNSDTWQMLLKYFNICLNNNLPFSTFDILKTLSVSSLVAAKAFIFLIFNDEQEKFLIEYCEELEDDLGFSFHWITNNDWSQALQWIGAYENEELCQVLMKSIAAYFSNLYPNNNFSKIHKYILTGQIDQTQPINTHENINNLKSSFGERILKELPKDCPKIPEEFKQVLPINETNSMVKILLKAPLAVALSICGKDQAIWKQESDAIRRNIKYCKELNPKWYSEAICYCLSKL